VVGRPQLRVVAEEERRRHLLPGVVLRCVVVRCVCGRGGCWCVVMGWLADARKPCSTQPAAVGRATPAALTRAALRPSSSAAAAASASPWAAWCVVWCGVAQDSVPGCCQAACVCRCCVPPQANAHGQPLSVRPRPCTLTARPWG
jgi:hypothetical protein